MDLKGKLGVIAEGAQGDLTFFEPEATFSAKKRELFHKNKLTRYDGHPSAAWSDAPSSLRGHTIYQGEVATRTGSWPAAHA